MNKKILIVDDYQPILEVLQIVFEGEGFEVVTWAKVAKIESIKKENPDIILLDIFLSGQDGREIAKQILANEHTKRIPVILMSANANVEKSAMESGARNFIAKPFDVADIVALIKKNL